MSPNRSKRKTSWAQGFQCDSIFVVVAARGREFRWRLESRWFTKGIFQKKLKCMLPTLNVCWDPLIVTGDIERKQHLGGGIMSQGIPSF